MIKDEKDLKRIAKWAKKMGLRRVRMGKIELDFSEAELKEARIEARGGEKRKESADETLASIPTTDDPNAKMPADGDLLFWSTGSFDLTTITRKEDEPRN